MKARCNKCETVFKGEPDAYNVLVCTNCGAKMRVRPSDPEPSAPEKPASRTPSTAKPAAASATPSAGRLPVLMRANKVIAGKTCPICQGSIDLGVQVHNCESCSTSHHAECWDEKGGCAAAGCASGSDEKPAKRGAAKDEPSDDDGGDTKPCKFCGESIKANARKCRFCDEYQNERDRQAQMQRASGNPVDDDMTGGDWIVAILCSTIGCIAGIVWCIQGKKKGPKMVLVCIIVNVVVLALRVMAEVAGGR